MKRVRIITPVLLCCTTLMEYIHAPSLQVESIDKYNDQMSDFISKCIKNATTGSKDAKKFGIRDGVRWPNLDKYVQYIEFSERPIAYVLKAGANLFNLGELKNNKSKEIIENIIQLLSNINVADVEKLWTEHAKDRFNNFTTLNNKEEYPFELFGNNTEGGLPKLLFYAALYQIGTPNKDNTKNCFDNNISNRALKDVLDPIFEKITKNIVKSKDQITVTQFEDMSKAIDINYPVFKGPSRLSQSKPQARPSQSALQPNQSSGGNVKNGNSTNAVMQPMEVENGPANRVSGNTLSGYHRSPCHRGTIGIAAFTTLIIIGAITGFRKFGISAVNSDNSNAAHNTTTNAPNASTTKFTSTSDPSNHGNTSKTTTTVTDTTTTSTTAALCDHIKHNLTQALMRLNQAHLYANCTALDVAIGDVCNELCISVNGLFNGIALHMLEYPCSAQSACDAYVQEQFTHTGCSVNAPNAQYIQYNKAIRDYRNAVLAQSNALSNACNRALNTGLCDFASTNACKALKSWADNVAQSCTEEGQISCISKEITIQFDKCTSEKGINIIPNPIQRCHDILIGYITDLNRTLENISLPLNAPFLSQNMQCEEIMSWSSIVAQQFSQNNSVCLLPDDESLSTVPISCNPMTPGPFELCDGVFAGFMTNYLNLMNKDPLGKPALSERCTNAFNNQEIGGSGDICERISTSQKAIATECEGSCTKGTISSNAPAVCNAQRAFRLVQTCDELMTDQIEKQFGIKNTPALGIANDPGSACEVMTSRSIVYSNNIKDNGPAENSQSNNHALQVSGCRKDTIFPIPSTRETLASLNERLYDVQEQLKNTKPGGYVAMRIESKDGTKEALCNSFNEAMNKLFEYLDGACATGGKSFTVSANDKFKGCADSRSLVIEKCDDISYQISLAYNQRNDGRIVRADQIAIHANHIRTIIKALTKFRWNAIKNAFTTSGTLYIMNALTGELFTFDTLDGLILSLITTRLAPDNYRIAGTVRQFVNLRIMNKDSMVIKDIYEAQNKNFSAPIDGFFGDVENKNYIISRDCWEGGGLEGPNKGGEMYMDNVKDTWPVISGNPWEMQVAQYYNPIISNMCEAVEDYGSAKFYNKYNTHQVKEMYSVNVILKAKNTHTSYYTGPFVRSVIDVNSKPSKLTSEENIYNAFEKLRWNQDALETINTADVIAPCNAMYVGNTEGSPFVCYKVYAALQPFLSEYPKTLQKWTEFAKVQNRMYGLMLWISVIAKENAYYASLLDTTSKDFINAFNKIQNCDSYNELLEIMLAKIGNCVPVVKIVALGCPLSDVIKSKNEKFCSDSDNKAILKPRISEIIDSSTDASDDHMHELKLFVDEDIDNQPIFS